MPRTPSKNYINLYDVGPDGRAKAVLFGEDGSETVLLEMSTLSELRKIIHDYKRDNGLQQILTTPMHGQFYSHNGVTKTAEEVKPLPRQPVNKRFSMAAEIIEMIINDYITSVVLCGQGGCGKSYTVLEILHKHGYQSRDSSKDKYYKHLRGSVSPMELYKFLYMHKNELIVFDDADAVFQTETSCNILKAVLDTTGSRTVAWYSGALDDEIPNEFEFNGKIIFISNRVMDRIPNPIQSRAMLLDLSFTREELVHRMRELAPKMCPYLSERQRADLLDHIEKHVHVFKNISLRTLDKAAKIVKASKGDWKDTVLFAG
jgi:hypothetical protein